VLKPAVDGAGAQAILDGWSQRQKHLDGRAEAGAEAEAEAGAAT